MTRGERLLEMCKDYSKTEGATCSGMLAKIESFLSAPTSAADSRLWAVQRELMMAKDDIKVLRKTQLTQAGILIAEKAVESIDKLGYAYTYTLAVAMYFRQRGFQVDRTEHKVSYIIREPEEEEKDD